MCNNNNSDCKCVSDILKVINILQKKAIRRDEECDNSCDRGVLGRPVCCFQFNTRPIQLFLSGKNGNDPLVMPTTRDPITPTTTFSSVFRVEKVDDCCCTCRVLVEEPTTRDPDGFPVFEATDSFFTIDLKCVCAIRCLDDTFVECL